MTDVSAQSRVHGLLLGFAVGDALGAPAAGIPGGAFLSHFGRIRSFVRNPLHPYLGHLEAGQFTENTELLLDAARDYAATGGIDRDRRIKSLTDWAKRVTSDPTNARWPGPTTLEGARRLAEGSAPNPGSAYGSVGAAYRCLPIAVVSECPRLALDVQEEARLTDTHPESIACAVILTLCLHQVLKGTSIEEAAQHSLQRVQQVCPSEELSTLCANALSSDEDLEDLSRRFGTGARCRETLPLSFAIASQNYASFSDAIAKAAGCYKSDRDVAAGGPWSRETAATNGGNTDGIAAIVGALLGALHGAEVVLEYWSNVEGRDRIREIAERLYRASILH